MRITAIPSNLEARNKTRGESWARALVFSLLKKIVKGRLVVEENGSERCFGQAPEAAEVQARVRIKNGAAYRRIALHGSVGAGEAYMDDCWESPDLVAVIRLMCLNLAALSNLDQQRPWWQRVGASLYHLARRNNKAGARRNIAAHYDLSNDFFGLFLDPTMAYSSALFKSETDSLEQASRQKFDHICRRLQLKAEDHLVEIGTGWGGLAIHAAREYGCRVTTTTLSKEQHDYAREWVDREGLSDRITLLLKDYRDLEGRFDKLVSVEMIEAVGAQYYDSYFNKCSSLLRDDGLMLLQCITISDQRYRQSLNNVDFIKRYIFPGGQLPSNSVMADKLAQETDMQLIGLEDMTRDYALTLKAWRERFWRRIDDVKKLGADDPFIRLWHYYLCFCEGGFRERVIHAAQFLTAKPAFRETPPLI